MNETDASQVSLPIKTVSPLIPLSALVAAFGFMGTLLGVGFWVGTRLTAIETGVVNISENVKELKSSVKMHNSLPGHPRAYDRLLRLEEYHKHTGKP